MGKTIEERLNILQQLNFRTVMQETGERYPSAYYEHWVDSALALTADIIADWNAALEVIKAVADKSVYQLGDDVICEECRKYARASIEIEHDLGCPVGALLRLIAKMEGEE